MNKIPIFNPETWRETAATLRRNRTRTFLTAFGIFWGTAMLTLLLGASWGFKGIISRQFAGFATNAGGFAANSTSMAYRGFNKGHRWDITQTDVDNIRRTAPYIDRITSLNWAMADATSPFGRKNVQIIGADVDYGHIQTLHFPSGRFINEADVQGVRKVAVIGQNLAAQLFPGTDPTGRHISIAGIDFLIIGQAHQYGEASIGGRVDDCILIPSSTLRRTFARGNKVDFVTFTSVAGHTPTDSREAIMRVLRASHPIHPDDDQAVWLMDISEMFEMINKLFAGISLLALFIGASSLLAGVIGVGNIMWVIVKERTPEFGIRRAIGATPADITLQVLSESVVLTLGAGTAGVVFSTVILAVIDHVTADPLLGMAGFEMPFGVAVAILGIFILLGSAAGTLPAIRAMKIKPVQAMQDK